MNFSKIENCKDCPYIKCLFRIDNDFTVCPVEEKKEELVKVD